MHLDHSQYPPVRKQDPNCPFMQHMTFINKMKLRNCLSSRSWKYRKAMLYHLFPSNIIYYELFYGTSQIIFCKESWNKIKGRCNTKRLSNNGRVCSKTHSFNFFLSEFIFFNERRSKVLPFAKAFTVPGKASKIKAYSYTLQ